MVQITNRKNFNVQTSECDWSVDQKWSGEAVGSDKIASLILHPPTFWRCHIPHCRTVGLWFPSLSCWTRPHHHHQQCDKYFCWPTDIFQAAVSSMGMCRLLGREPGLSSPHAAPARHASLLLLYHLLEFFNFDIDAQRTRTFFLYIVGNDFSTIFQTFLKTWSLHLKSLSMKISIKNVKDLKVKVQHYWR